MSTCLVKDIQPSHIHYKYLGGKNTPILGLDTWPGGTQQMQVNLPCSQSPQWQVLSHVKRNPEKKNVRMLSEGHWVRNPSSLFLYMHFHNSVLSRKQQAYETFLGCLHNKHVNEVCDIRYTLPFYSFIFAGVSFLSAYLRVPTFWTTQEMIEEPQALT